MRTTWGTRLVSLAVAGAMIASVPLGALAASFDLKDGDIKITAGEEKNTVEQKAENNRNSQSDRTEELDKDEKIEIKNSSEDGETKHSVTVVRDEDLEDDVDVGTVKLEMEDVTIKNTFNDDDEDPFEEWDDSSYNDGAAIRIGTRDGKEGEGVDVELTVKGKNTIEDGSIRVERGNLTITGEEGSSLTVKASEDSGAAAIGTAGGEVNGGAIAKDLKGGITITGGVSVDAEGSADGGAGIGTGKGISMNGGAITINTTGDVTATGGTGAAGIGTGAYSDEDTKGEEWSEEYSKNLYGSTKNEISSKASINITTKENIITATGGAGAAGIGTGSGGKDEVWDKVNEEYTGEYAYNNDLKGKINIDTTAGGTVTATGGSINKNEANEKKNNDKYIWGVTNTQTEVTTWYENETYDDDELDTVRGGGAGIGTGVNGQIRSGNNITITTSDTNKSTVTATGKDGGAGIGTGAGGKISAKDAVNVTASKNGTVTATSEGSAYTISYNGSSHVYSWVKKNLGGAGIGTGFGGDLTGSITATVDGGTLKATSNNNGAGIGTGAGGSVKGTVTAQVTENGGTLTAQGASGIGSGSTSSYSEKTSFTSSATKTLWNKVTGTINAILKAGKLTAKATTGAGIGTGTGGDLTGTINVTADGGTLEAKSKDVGAGIGTGNNANINGGTINVTANGGAITAEGKDGSAGIGTGYNAKMNAGAINVTASAGSITANGSSGASGIGTGEDGDITGGSSIKILLNGGAVEAVGKNGGAGVGTGEDGGLVATEGKSGIIKIFANAGKLIATGKAGGAGIGTGSQSADYDFGIEANADGSANIEITTKDGIVEATAESTSKKTIDGVKQDVEVEGGAAIGTGKQGVFSGLLRITGEEGGSGYVKAIASLKAASLGAGAGNSTGHIHKDDGTINENTGKKFNGTIEILDYAKVLANGNIGSSSDVDKDGNAMTDGTDASYLVDCTATIADADATGTEDVHNAFREAGNWLWDDIKSRFTFTEGDEVTETKNDDGTVVYKNGSLTINCHEYVAPQPEQPIDLTNTGVIASTDPAAQRWYWVTALFDADENVGYTYQQIGSNLIVNADEAAQAAVLHVLLSGWAEHTDVQSITFVTAGKTTTLYASEMLGITTGEHLTLTHEGTAASLAVDGADYTALLGEAVA